MHISGAEAANWSVLLSFPVKIYAKAKLLSEGWGACPLDGVKDERSQRLILKAIRATEMHMAQSCIAMGILQGISIHSVGKLTSDQLRYQRTPSRGRVSEGALMAHLRKYFFLFMEKQPELYITQIIQEQQDTSGIYWDSLAS